MTLESDVNHMLRTLTRKELNAYTVSYNELVKQGNTGHVDEILWDPILQAGGEWPSSSSSSSGGGEEFDCSPGCVEVSIYAYQPHDSCGECFTWLSQFDQESMCNMVGSTAGSCGSYCYQDSGNPSLHFCSYCCEEI